MENLLLLRKTSKEKFSNKKISLSEINKIVNGYKNNVRYFQKGSQEYDYIKENAIQAYEIQGKNLGKREELSNWFRFSDEQTKEKKDGLSAEMLGMNSFKKFFYYKFYNKEKVQNINFLKEEMKLIKKQVNSAEGFLLITAKDNSVKENINAGIVLENIWLNATKEKIKIQPLSQILEEEPFNININKDLKIDGEIKMLLRIGYSSNNKKVKKLRKTVEDILINMEF